MIAASNKKEADLDSFFKAYAGDNIYDVDNQVILSWYPKRMMEQVEGTRSLLELGMGLGFTTTIFPPLRAWCSTARRPSLPPFGPPGLQGRDRRDLFRAVRD